jgi:hypothetical protein
MLAMVTGCAGSEQLPVERAASDFGLPVPEAIRPGV